MANVINSSPFGSTQPTGSTLQNDFTGPSGEKLVSDTHGKWYNAARAGRLFTYNVTAVTLPVVASNLASKFALYNPPASGVNLEIVRFDIGVVLATTVVNTVGLYYTAGTAAQASTFTTPGTALSCMVGNAPTNAGVPYSALAHSGTPGRHTILGFFGATTTTFSDSWNLHTDGAIIVPPGVVVSVAMSTAAATTSSFDVGVTWLEVSV